MGYLMLCYRCFSVSCRGREIHVLEERKDAQMSVGLLKGMPKHTQVSRRNPDAHIQHLIKSKCRRPYTLADPTLAVPADMESSPENKSYPPPDHSGLKDHSNVERALT